MLKKFSNNEQAMFLMASAVLLIPIADSVAKWLGGWLSVGEIAWLRFVLQSALIAGLIVFQAQKFGTYRFWYAVLGLQIAAAMLFLYWGLQHLPLVNNIVIFFAEPLLLLILAGIFLGERIVWQRWLAVVVGLLGVVIVLRPNWSLYGWAALLPLMSALCFAAYMATVRAYSRRFIIKPLALQFWVGTSGAVLLGLFVLVGHHNDVPIAQWQWPNATQWSLLFVLGALTAISHLFISKALSKGDASLLAPFQYLEILGASLLGWWFFHEIPDTFTLIGGFIIVASGVWLFTQERQLARSNVNLVN